MLFGKSDQTKFLEALQSGDVPLLKEVVKRHPEYLVLKFYFGEGGSYNGICLHAAAFYNQPEVIEFLVKEKNVPVNGRQGANHSWTALHHACVRECYPAAQKLLQLGADPKLKNAQDQTPIQLCASEHMRVLLSPSTVIQHTQEQKKPDEWSLLSPGEIMHVRDLPDNSYRLTDIFNFETRRMLSITKDLKSGNMAQENLFFDDISDTGVIHQAHAKYLEKGGKISAGAIDVRSLKGKQSDAQPKRGAGG